MKVQVQW